eukprot:m.178312 g.178312  ORF g.178312 m.178312 type:complete len:548 (-) comp14523_c0_seq1:40-1683(-)
MAASVSSVLPAFKKITLRPAQRRTYLEEQQARQRIDRIERLREELEAGNNARNNEDGDEVDDEGEVDDVVDEEANNEANNGGQGYRRHYPIDHRNLDDEHVDDDAPGSDKMRELLQRFPDDDDGGLPGMDKDELLELVRDMRIVLSAEMNPPIAAAVGGGAVQILMEVLEICEDMPDLNTIVFEAVWAITNIASGASEHTRAVVEAGVLPTLVELLDHDREDIADQAIWALGNIAGDSTEFRDMVLEYGALGSLVSALTDDDGELQAPVKMLRNGAWTLSNLCRGKPPPPILQVAEAIPMLNRMLIHDDDEVSCDACWALGYLADVSVDHIIDDVDIGHIVQLVDDPVMHKNFQAPALRVLGGLVTGNNEQTQMVLDAGLLRTMPKLLAHGRQVIVKDACWILSNVTAGTSAQIQEVMDAGLIPTIVHIFEHRERKVAMEALWTIANIASGGTREQVTHVFDDTVLDLLWETIGSYDKDDEMARVAVDGIVQALDHPGMPHAVAESMSLSDWQSLESMQEMQHGDLGGRATSVLNKLELAGIVPPEE